MLRLHPAERCDWANERFDFPDLVWSKQYRYLTTNVLKVPGNQNNKSTRSVVTRLPLAQQANSPPLTGSYHRDTQFTPRATHGATETKCSACHADRYARVTVGFVLKGGPLMGSIQVNLVNLGLSP